LTVDRYTRQRRLAWIGDAGQTRILGSSYEVRGQDGADVERAYLERAGAASVTALPALPPPRFAHAETFRFDAARALAAGAWRALSQLRDTLEKADP
jgi:hypothetical protein